MIHEYSDVYYAMLWDIVDLYIPELIETINGVIGLEMNQTDDDTINDDDQTPYTNDQAR